MEPNRQQIFEGPGPVIGPTGYSLFATQATESEIRSHGEFICDLSHLHFLSARGPDAISFLNGQLSNDLLNLSDSESQISGYCTPKGRLLCVFRLHRNSEHVVLQANKSVLPSVAERLGRFILRAKVELNIENSITSFGVVGQQSGKSLTALLGELPQRANDYRTVSDVSVICHSLSDPLRYQVIGAPSALADLWQQLSRSVPGTGSWAWASLDIAQGRPTIFPETSEQFVPQSVNMDIIGAVSFNKGCYPGQEIVARMHYLGKLKTRMIRAGVDSPDRPPVPGDKLYTSTREQSIGMLVDATPAECGYDILSTVRLENLGEDAGDLRIHQVSGPIVVQKQLPYPLQSPQQKQA
jgi:folate-binding protein YgfZ